jgi:hypothetical protein
LYPPDYVSEETLAIGGLKRWDFASVRAFVEAQNAPARRLAPNGRPDLEDDPFLAALTNGQKDGHGASG